MALADYLPGFLRRDTPPDALKAEAPAERPAITPVETGAWHRNADGNESRWAVGKSPAGFHEGTEHRYSSGDQTTTWASKPAPSLSEAIRGAQEQAKFNQIVDRNGGLNAKASAEFSAYLRQGDPARADFVGPKQPGLDRLSTETVQQAAAVKAQLAGADWWHSYSDDFDVRVRGAAQVSAATQAVGHLAERGAAERELASTLWDRHAPKEFNRPEWHVPENRRTLSWEGASEALKHEADMRHEVTPKTLADAAKAQADYQARRADHTTPFLEANAARKAAADDAAAAYLRETMAAGAAANKAAAPAVSERVSRRAGTRDDQPEQKQEARAEESEGQKRARGLRM